MIRARKTSLLAAAVLGLTLLAGVEAKAQSFAGSAQGGWGSMMAWTAPTTTTIPTATFGMMPWTSSTTSTNPTTGTGSITGFQEIHNSMWNFMEDFWR